MDVKEYRRQYEEELAEAARQKASYRDFLDRSRSAPERLMAFEASEGAESREAVAESLDVVLDQNEDFQIRISALDAISIEVGESHELIDAVLGLLQANEQPAPLRRAALRVLQQSSFNTQVFSSKRPDYLAALRSIVRDGDPDLRQQAMEALALEKDEFVQRLLLEGLEDPSRALVPPEKAIQMLGHDIHAEHYPFLREIVMHPPNPSARREAVRLLGADASAKDLLAEILANRGEDSKIRTASAVALQSLAPEEFEAAARHIVLDDTEDDDVRATSLSALDHFANQESLSRDATFNERVREMRQNPATRELGRAAARYEDKEKE
jgi:HEAT repeat protein